MHEMFDEDEFKKSVPMIDADNFTKKISKYAKQGEYIIPDLNTMRLKKVNILRNML